MKCLLIVMLMFLSSVAFAQHKKVTIVSQTITVKNALENLQKQTDLALWFNTADVDQNKVISVNLHSRSIDDALDAILSGQHVCYEIKGNHIIIARKKAQDATMLSMLETVERRIQGVVTDETGQVLSNVVVRDKASRVAAVTDDQGRFSIQIPAVSKILLFSYMGLKPIEISAYNGMKVLMEQENRSINEVVVTALDIKRDKKSLPYSSQSIETEEIAKGREMNLTTSLSGVISGINVLQSESGAGGSTKITLRGPKNITSTNQPLFVIDGVPVANYQTADPFGFYSGRDSGDGLSNINPEEIESMTILKGANAAALYGSQGSNGVILITTKKGVAGTTKISLNSGVTITAVSEYPALQYTYGQTAQNAEDSWGNKGVYPNVQKDFFNTGLTMQHSLSLSGGNEKTTAYFSYGNAYALGIVPTNKYIKHNVSFRQTSSFLDNQLMVSSNVMLTTELLHNTILTGYYWNPLLGLYNFPRGLDFNYYKQNYQILNTNRNIMAQNWPVAGNAEGEMNPYWILHNDPDDTNTKRIIGNITLKYKLRKGLVLSARGNYDYTNQLYEMKAKATSSPVLVSENGRYLYSNLNSWQAYGDVLLTFDNAISKDIDIHAVLGAAYQKKVVGDGLYIDSNVYGLTIVNNFTIQNISSLLAFTSAQQMAARITKESLFGNLSLGYKGIVYFDLSGRKDWASSLAFTDHLGYYYPSVGLSCILSQMTRLPKVISYAKIRGSFAEVSNEIPAFISNVTGTVSVNGYKGSFVKAFTNLKPEMSDNFEAGIDLRLFQNRLGIDFTCYQIDNRDQYLQLEAPSGSGYTAYYINAGHVRTKGMELTLNATPFSNHGFVWNSALNYSRNHNKIITLSNQLTGYYTLPGGGEGYDMKVVSGGSMGDLYTFAYMRDDNGNILLDDRHIPMKTTIEKKVGSANPDWMLGWNNRFTYKRLQFSFIVDGKFGGKFISMTQAYLDRNGVTKATADARDAGGVQVSGVMPDGTSWSGKVDAKEYYTGTAGRGGIMEKYVYDATNVRLRQMVVGYSQPLSKLTGKVLKEAVFSFITSNLFYFYKKAPGNPNMTISTGNGTQAVENFGLPLVRSFTFNVQLTL